MRIIYLLFIFSFIMGGLGKNPVYGQNRSVVQNVEDLKSAIENPNLPDTLVLSENFAEINTAISFNLLLTRKVVIDGNNQELKVTNDSRYFNLQIAQTTNNGELVFRNMTFRGTNAGGGVLFRGAIHGAYPTLVFENTHFVSIKGSALCSRNPDRSYTYKPTIKIRNSTFEDNRTDETSGGAIFAEGKHDLIIENCAFIGNRSTKTDGSGGAICLFGATGSCDIGYSLFRENEASEHGGAISVHNAYGARLYVHSCYFEANKVVCEDNNYADGGAISIFSPNDDCQTSVSVIKSTFYRNEAEDDAGAVFIQTGDDSFNRIENCVFFENVAKDAMPKILASNDTGTAGGAIHVSINTQLELVNNTIAGNYTQKKAADETMQGGGGIGYYYHGNYSRGSVSLENNIIVGNYTLVMPDRTIIEGPYANVGFHENYGGPNVNLSGTNIGYDAMPDAEWYNPDNTLGKNPTLWENLGDKIDDPRYAGLEDENAPAKYRQIVPSLSILPHINDTVGIANEACETNVLFDIRGVDRKEGDRQDVGAVEIVWARFDANGGVWKNLPDLDSYKGTEYYEKDASGDVERYYLITYLYGEVTAPPHPVRDGYVFDGWEFTPDGISWDGQPYATDGNDSLIATWIKAVCPPTSTWKTEAVDSDWNNPENWSDGVPGKCTRVTISSGADYYPVITADTDPEAMCHTIHFEFGGEVAGTPFLDYDSASVDLTLDNSRWYMLSAPLMDMYAGDYFLTETRRNPGVQMMQYQKDNPQYTSVTKQRGKWSKTFNTLRVPLPAADGFALEIDLDETGENTPYTFTFPRHETVYNYYTKSGKPSGRTTETDDPGGPMDREHNGRFIYEIAPGCETGSFRLPIENANSDYEKLIIGNPFMAHLDLVRLYVVNKDYLTGDFDFWTGSSIIQYKIIFATPVSTEDELDQKQPIPPMQSIFAGCIGDAFDGLQFDSRMTIIDPSVELRSAASPFDGLLHIKVSRDGERESGAAIVYMKGVNNSYEVEKDAKVFFISNLSNEPAVIYSAVDGQALAIHTVGDLSQNIELGISTSVVGKLTLDFKGMDSFDPNDKIEFVDRQLGEVLNLRETASYTFDNQTGDVEGRFYLRVSTTPTRTDDLSAEKDIHVYVESGVLYVSAPDEILRVEVSNLQGQSLYQRTATGKARLEIPLILKGQPAIVKIQTAGAVKIQKVLVD